MSYVLPDGVTLKNKLNATTRDQLDRVTALRTGQRLQEIRDGLGPPCTFDAAHLKALHGHIFQDVFEWAGRTRDEKIALADGTIAYAPRIAKMG